VTKKYNYTDIVLPLCGILLVAINLRPVITAVGPIMPRLGSDLTLNASQLGLLGALPIAMFAIVSAGSQAIIARFGVERTTAGALALLTLGTLWRSWPGASANLWAGTALIGATIAVGNVAVPVIVKKVFPHAMALVTSIYVAVLGIFAGLAAAVAVPLADSSSWSWRLSLGVWAVLTLVGAFYWAVHAARAHQEQQSRSRHRGTRTINIWRNLAAWQIATYMGVQSSVFYVSLTWLPSVEQGLGVSPVAAGWHMFLLQIAGVVGNLAAPVLMRIGRDQQFAAVLPGLLFVVALAGIYFHPAWLVFWDAVLGLGTGTAFVVSLSLIAMRAGDVSTASRLSSMAQAIGYGITALNLYVAGLVEGLNPLAPLAVLSLAGVCVLVMGLFAGRQQRL